MIRLLTANPTAKRLPNTLALLAVSLLIGLQSGCAGLGLGAARPVTWYTLNDQRTKPALTKQRNQNLPKIQKVLLIGPVDSNPFFNSTQLAYSRSDIARAYYQFAAWTERPAKRLATLIERRLVQRNRFLSVVSSTAGVRGDLMLTVSLEEIFHDAAVKPGSARIQVRARLVDWTNRTLIAERVFSQTSRVTTPNAEGAVRSLGQATTAVLDNLSRWIESVARPANTPEMPKTSDLSNQRIARTGN